MAIRNFDETISRLRKYLPQYLEEHGIDTSKHFKCINPNHQDDTPSCSVAGGNGRETFHCFGMGCSGNIFTAAHYLENKPLTGKEFIYETLLPLAEKFKVPVEVTELTEEEIYELDTYRAYRTAASLITLTGRASEYAKSRGLSETTCRTYCAGGVESYSWFRGRLKDAGFPAGFLDDIDLGRKDLFNENNLIFTIFDESDRPIGFAARNLDYEKGAPDERSKYVNSRTTGVKCNIYQKGKRLYGLNKASNSRPLYIFEGYIDVLTASQAGVNCAGICGTALTVEHLATLRENNFFDVVLCLDGDEAGQSKIEKILDDRFSSARDFKVKVVALPEGQDPDDFIKTKGADEFFGLAHWSSFEWRLNRYSDEADSQEVCDHMVSVIVSEPNHIIREKDCKLLAEATGFSLKTIQLEVERHLSLLSQDKAIQRDSILQKAFQDLQKDPKVAEIVLQDTLQSIQDLDKQFDDSFLSFDSCIEYIRHQKETEESRSGEFAGFRLGQDLIGLEQAMNGQCKRDVLCFFGGGANSGKSSLLTKMLFSAISIPENNAIGILHSIDDSLEQALPRFVCVAEGSKRLEINQVLYPQYHAVGRPEVLQRRQDGYQILEGLLRQNKLLFKDSTHGDSLAFAEALISRVKREFPDKNIIYVLDNFHLLSDFPSLDERVRYKTLSRKLKSLATRHHIAIWATVEYKKSDTGQRPTNNSVAETVQLQYDGNFIGHIWNEVHERGAKAELFHTDEEGNILPIVELIVGKNKISSFKSSVFMNFFPASADFTTAPFSSRPTPVRDFVQGQFSAQSLM